jgi:hypothetical protein
MPTLCIVGALVQSCLCKPGFLRNSQNCSQSFGLDAGCSGKSNFHAKAEISAEAIANPAEAHALANCADT